MENPLVVSAGAGEVLPAMLDQMADGHYTFTDTELHEILGVVINNTNSSNPDDCELCHPTDVQGTTEFRPLVSRF